MSILNSIKQDQPVFYKELFNAFETNKIPHAFLLVGDGASDIAHYIAMSIVCDDVVACETCNTCSRIKNHTYADLIYASGKDGTIKVEVANKIQEQFNKTAIEGKSRIYLLEHIENATPSTMNKLLKILEEPEEDIYAIFTTSNMNKVLPTIISRCMVVKLLPASKQTLKQQLVEAGCQKDNINILSELFSSYSECEPYINNEEFDYIKLQVNYFIEDLFLKRDNLMINMHTHLLKKDSTKRDFVNKDDMHLFLNLLVFGLKDLFHVKHGLPVVLESFKSTFDRIEVDDEELLKKIEIVLNTDYALDTNANIALLLDSMMYEL